MGNIDSRSQREDTKFADAMDLSHRVLHSLNMLRRSILSRYGPDAFLLLDDFSLALVTEVDGKQDPFLFMMSCRFAEGFQNPQTKTVYRRVVKRWGDRKTVEGEFGFLLAHYVEEYCNWNTTADQESEILKRIKAWMDENDAYTMTSRSDKVPVPCAEDRPDPDSQPSTEPTEHGPSRAPDKPDSSVTLSGHVSEASGG